METKQFVSFRIYNYLMGIDILKVREIIQLAEITIVQNAPDVIWGLMNLRGQTIIVIDIGVLFGLPSRKITPDSHNIIMKSSDLSIVADKIGEIVTVPADLIEPCPANIDKKIYGYLDNVVKLDDEILVLLSPEKIIKKISE